MNSQILDRARLDAAYVTFSTLFDMQLARTPTDFQDICTVMPVASTVTEFKWLGDVPKMKEWIGQRALNKLRAETHQIRTKNWANGIEVERDDLDDDKLGLIRPRIEQLAQEGMWHIEDLVFDIINDALSSGAGGGTLALCYDGQPLFDTDHTASGSGGTSQSNFEDGAFDETNYQDAWAKMMNFVDEKGNKLRIMPDTLVVGVANRTVARKLIQQQTKASGEQNIEAGTSRLIVSPRMSGPATSTNWFLASTAQAVRALIVLIRQAPRFAAADSMSGDEAFMTGNFKYGADARHGVGLGLWQTVVGGDGA